MGSRGAICLTFRLSLIRWNRNVPFLETTESWSLMYGISFSFSLWTFSRLIWIYMSKLYVITAVYRLSVATKHILQKYYSICSWSLVDAVCDKWFSNTAQQVGVDVEDLNQAQTHTFSYNNISGQRNESAWLRGESGLNTDGFTGCRKDVTQNRDGHTTVGDQR